MSTTSSSQNRIRPDTRNRAENANAAQAREQGRTSDGQGSQTSTEAIGSGSTTTERIASRPPTVEMLGGSSAVARAESVEETPSPWDVSPLSTRVAELMTTDNLSRDAAIVLAMTERGADPSSASGLDESWRGEFARMVTRSGTEIATWAQTQEVGAITFVPGDNDIRVTQRADGMVVIESSLNGTVQSTQVVDPSATDRIVINAGSGDDQIVVDDSVTASLLLAGGDGQDFIYGGAGNEIIIGGDGDDLVRAGGGTDIVLGGRGNDNLEGQDGSDLLFGQEGDDYLSGDEGSDIALGGAGQDTLYGGDGEDLLMGEQGNDYLDAGGGNDLATGGAGDDVVSGGKGDDEVQGNAGADRLIGASGADRFTAVDGNDTVIVDSESARNGIASNVPGADVRFVEYDANAGRYAVSVANGQREEFATRVEDDLETLRSLDSGQTMLNALDQARRDTYRPDRRFLGINIGGGRPGHRVAISELDGAGHIDWVRNPVRSNRGASTENGFAAPTGGRWTTSDPVNSPTRGSGVNISYNPSVNLELNSGAATPPVVILFHEMAHAYNMTTGTGLEGIYNGTDPRNNGGTVNSFERQAVGLPVDHDNDPTTAEQRIDEGTHPFELTENGLRDELGLTPRPFY